MLRPVQDESVRLPCLAHDVLSEEEVVRLRLPVLSRRHGSCHAAFFHARRAFRRHHVLCRDNLERRAADRFPGLGIRLRDADPAHGVLVRVFHDERFLPRRAFRHLEFQEFPFQVPFRRVQLLQVVRAIGQHVRERELPIIIRLERLMHHLVRVARRHRDRLLVFVQQPERHVRRRDCLSGAFVLLHDRHRADDQLVFLVNALERHALFGNGHVERLDGLHVLRVLRLLHPVGVEHQRPPRVFLRGRRREPVLVRPDYQHFLASRLGRERELDSREPLDGVVVRVQVLDELDDFHVTADHVLAASHLVLEHPRRRVLRFRAVHRVRRLVNQVTV